MRLVSTSIQRLTNDARALLRRFELSISSAGELRIRPAGPRLCYMDLDDVLLRIMDRKFTGVVIDFTAISEIASPWTPVVARLVDFARQAGCRCKLTNLHGQASVVIRFLTRDDVIRRILEVDLDRGEPSHAARVVGLGRASRRSWSNA